MAGTRLQSNHIPLSFFAEGASRRSTPPLLEQSKNILVIEIGATRAGRRQPGRCTLRRDKAGPTYSAGTVVYAIVSVPLALQG